MDDITIISQIWGAIKTYGPEISLLLIAIFYLVHENAKLHKDVKTEQKLREQLAEDHSQELLALSKENIAALASMAHLIESLAPAIGDVTGKVQKDFAVAVLEIKQHISENCRIIERAISSRTNSRNSMSNNEEESND